MWNMKVGVSKRAQWGPICEPRQLGIMLLPLLCCQHCLLPTWAKLLNYYGPPLNIKFAISFWRLQTGELFLWGIVENLGQCVGCAQWLILGWARETGAPLRTPPPLFRLLIPTSSGKKPTPDIIRWILKRTKAPLHFFTLPVGGKKGKQKPHPMPNHLLCVCMHVYSPVSLVFVL